jgi:uncharacterized protein YdeI (YjbR/CyaY-like superfamily)
VLVEDDPRIRFATTEEFAAWIDAQGDAPDGLWLLVPRAGSGLVGISYAEALQVALARGWIDGQRRGGDVEGVFLQRFTPRRARSRWSKVNCAHVEKLIAAGRMTPRGMAEVDAAKADGRWDAAYDPPSKVTVPDDLAEALAARPGARESRPSKNSRNRFAVLHRIGAVKKPETRARKIQEYADMMQRHEKLTP